MMRRLKYIYLTVLFILMPLALAACGNSGNESMITQDIPGHWKLTFEETRQLLASEPGYQEHTRAGGYSNINFTKNFPYPRTQYAYFFHGTYLSYVNTYIVTSVASAEDYETLKAAYLDYLKSQLKKPEIYYSGPQQPLERQQKLESFALRDAGHYFVTQMVLGKDNHVIISTNFMNPDFADTKPLFQKIFSGRQWPNGNLVK